MARVGKQGGNPNSRQAVVHPRLRTIGSAAMRAAPIVGLLITWELIARGGAFTQFILPPFSVTAERIWADAISGELWRNISLTIYRASAGFLIGGAIGIAT